MEGNQGGDQVWILSLLAIIGLATLKLSSMRVKLENLDESAQTRRSSWRGVSGRGVGALLTVSNGIALRRAKPRFRRNRRGSIVVYSRGFIPAPVA